MSSQHKCVDCAALPIDDRPPRPRPAIHGGPRSRRCTTHHRVHREARKSRAAETRVRRVYGLASGEYEALLDLQGGTCAICCRSTGKARRLAVDHDHETGEVRGLLCSPCNKIILSYGGDVLRRAMRYLESPPMTLLRGAGKVAHGDAA